MKQLTTNIEVKTSLNPEKKDSLLKQISDAYKIIGENNLSLMAHKEAMTLLKEANEKESEKVASIIAIYDKGYESKMVECVAKYEKGEATFTDVHTGEVVEQRAITEEEQLRLSGKSIDAEQIIRQASKEEDEE